MTIGEAKLYVCKTAVDVVKQTMRDFGAVCENCASYHPYGTETLKDKGICRPDCHEVHINDFCQSFRFRSVEVCEPLYQKIVKMECKK